VRAQDRDGDGVLDELSARLASALGKEPVAWRTPHTGLSPATRRVVRFADGSSAFVKAAVDERTETWLRTEHAILTSIAERSLVPRVLAWIDLRPPRAHDGGPERGVLAS